MPLLLYFWSIKKGVITFKIRCKAAYSCLYSMLIW